MSSAKNETGQKIAMTSPVVSCGGGGGESLDTMQFVLPASLETPFHTPASQRARNTSSSREIQVYTRRSLSGPTRRRPAPTDPSVRLVDLPAADFAVVEYFGGWDETKALLLRDELVAGARADGLVVDPSKWQWCRSPASTQRHTHTQLFWEHRRSPAIFLYFPLSLFRREGGVAEHTFSSFSNRSQEPDSRYTEFPQSKNDSAVDAPESSMVLWMQAPLQSPLDAAHDEAK